MKSVQVDNQENIQMNSKGNKPCGENHNQKLRGQQKECKIQKKWQRKKFERVTDEETQINQVLSYETL